MRFEYAGPLNPDDHKEIIVHRPEFDRLLDHIQNRDYYVALRNSRQTGKTTLLYQIQARLHGNDYGIVYISLEGLDDLTEAEFYEYICTEIRDGLDELIDGVAEGELNPENVTNQIAFSKFLLELSRRTNARKLVIILDEIGGIPSEVSRTFLGRIRAFFTRGRRPSRDRDLYQKVMFIFAGALDMQRLTESENSPLRNVCELFSLADFSKEQSRRLSRNLAEFSADKIEVADDAVYDWCDGHPYLTQRLLALIESHPECRKVSVSEFPEIVSQLVTDEIVYGDDANLEHAFNHLRQDKAYQDGVFAILKQTPRQSIPLENDLESLGFIKRSSDDAYLIIRNRIYTEALKDFFPED